MRPRNREQYTRSTRQEARSQKPEARIVTLPLLASGFWLLVLCLLCTVPRTFGQSSRVVAIGDIHGDLDAFVGILQRTGLIDPSKRWSGGKAILVQTGDFLDR